MRNLRWAADHSVDPDPARAELGATELRVLGRATRFDPELRAFVDAAIDLVVSRTREA